MFFTITLNGTPYAHGVTARDAVALLNALALQDDGTTEISAVVERGTIRCATPFEPREMQ